MAIDYNPIGIMSSPRIGIFFARRGPQDGPYHKDPMLRHAAHKFGRDRRKGSGHAAKLSHGRQFRRRYYSFSEACVASTASLRAGSLSTATAQTTLSEI